MRTKINFFIVIIFVILFSVSIAYAETDVDAITNPQVEKSSINPWWINLGFGAGGSHDSDNNIGGVSGTASINYMISEHQLLTARYLQTDEFLGASSVRDAGLLYGFIAKAKYAYASASVGLGWAQYDWWKYGFLSPAVHQATYNTIGIPGEIQFFVTPFRYVGLGVIAFGDLNNKKTFVGGAVAIQFGNLR